MMPGLMNVENSRIGLSRPYPSYPKHLPSLLTVQKHVQQPTIIDYNKLKPYFQWVNAETIKKTIKNSTHGQLHLPDLP